MRFGYSTLLPLALLTTIASLNAPACSSAGGSATGGSVGSGGASGTGGATTTSDAGSADGDASAKCTFDPGPDAGACGACKAEKCCNTASAQKKKPGVWTNSAATVCAENECATECGLTVPKCGGITPDPASCVDALDAMCCAQVTACGQSDECVAVIYLCIDDQNHSPGTAAFNQCAAQYPEGLALFNVLNDCFTMVSCP